MISIHDLYNVLSAVIPLYVAMMLAYGSVRWWKIFTPDQCSGINRFVALFAVPLLSFHFIASNNPFTMNFQFLAADSLAKLMVIVVLVVWAKLSKKGSLDWTITLFSLATLPNTLVMGIPLLKAMYGGFSGDLMVQIVVCQCIIWYTLLLFLFEYRGARSLIADALPDAAPAIVSFKVDSDVISLDGRQALQTEAEIRGDGKVHVTIRKSTSSSARPSYVGAALALATTPRPSNMTGADIYSVPSSRNPTPRGSNFNHSDFYSMLAAASAATTGTGTGTGNGNTAAAGGIQPRASNFTPSDLFTGVTPRTSNFTMLDHAAAADNMLNVSAPPPPPPHIPANSTAALFPPFGYRRSTDRQLPGHHFIDNPLAYVLPKSAAHTTSYIPGAPPIPEVALSSSTGTNPKQPPSSKPAIIVDRPAKKDIDVNKDLHMFVWSSTTSPVSELGGGPHCIAAAAGGGGAAAAGCNLNDIASIDEASANHLDKDSQHNGLGESRDHFEGYATDSFSFGNRFMPQHEIHGTAKFPLNPATIDLASRLRRQPIAMPPTQVMTKLILIMVWRKLLRNPNTYSSLLGLAWSLVSARWGIAMPAIVGKSISILSDAGLGMAMFSLGLFMALQPKIIACGNSIAAFGMAVRFLIGPAVMAAASVAIGIRGILLHVAIIQAALPQGIVPFVFAKEYNNHPDILSTGVIFGMLIALPITILYYFLLGL